MIFGPQLCHETKISKGWELGGLEYLELFEIVMYSSFHREVVLLKDKFLCKRESGGALSNTFCADHFHENNLIVDVTPEYVSLF